MSFPWSYSVLGLVPGLILTVFIAAVVLYTSLTIWYVRPLRSLEYCANSLTGSSACVIPMFVMCVISVSTCSGTPGSPGI